MALSYTDVKNETIAAIATGLSESGIGIIRISGPDAITVGEKLYRNSRGQSGVSQWKANTIHFGYIVDPEDPSRRIDEVMVSIMRAPHSYTTEDTIEINCHGGVYLMNQVLQLALQNGCRMAEPGEFTKRAFLGGRIDLSKAEAVMDLIESDNEFSRRTALDQLEGSVSRKIRELREKILYQLAFIESALDDPENYSLDGYPAKLRRICSDLCVQLDEMLSYTAEGKILKDGIRTVIVGKPNTGKSSLMNRLAGENRAIVTNVAGTTRDTLEEKVRVGEVVLNLTDTAGIHETDDQVEQMGVLRAKTALERAELVLFLLDGSAPLEEADRSIASLIMKEKKTDHCITLLNKSDLPSNVTERETAQLFQKNSVKILSISAATGEGISGLKENIQQLFRTGEIAAKNEVFLSGVRQQQEVRSARNSLGLVIQSIDHGLSEDFFSIDLMNAYTSLGKILGEAVEDDLVEEIFSRFCLGK